MSSEPASTTAPTQRRLLTPRRLVILGLLGVLFVAASLWFAPWRLLTSTTVDEGLPVATARPTAAATPSPDAPSDQSERPPPETVELARGSLISHEHQTSGRVRVVELADGSRYVRLEDLETSDGPALEVWLSSEPVIDGTQGWGVFDDGKYLSLGALKGNRGNQNYQIPDGTDLSKYKSVSIWCERFRVSFGAAELNET